MSVSINHTPDYGEFDPKQKKVLQSIIVGKCTCVLGAAGTGKSYTVERAIDGTKYVLCPTGMLATAYENGMTLHQFCCLYGPTEIPSGKEGATLASRCATKMVRAGVRDKLQNEKPVIVLEEISMWPIAQFEFLNAVLKIVMGSLKVFGGLQIVCLGDHMQLPPVVKHAESPYEFSAFFSELMKHFVIHKLETLHRQMSTSGSMTEEDLEGRNATAAILQGIRRRKWTDDAYGMITYRRQLESGGNIEDLRTGDEIIMAYRRQQVSDINLRVLQALDGDLISIVPYFKNGSDALVESHTIQVKEGCEIIFTRKMRSCGQNPIQVVNGTRAILNFVSGPHRLTPDDHTHVHVSIEGDPRVYKFPMSITKTKPFSKTGSVVQDIQPPFQNGPAITIHKLQGATLDNAVLVTNDLAKDISLLYVALSRFKNIMNARLVGETIHPTSIRIPKGRDALDARTPLYSFLMRLLHEVHFGKK